MQTVTEMAYAKINLFLDVIDRRADGFHSIRTIMQTISLSDTVTLAAEASKYNSITLKIDGNNSLSSGCDNIVYKAAEAYLLRSGINADVNIRLLKSIPIGAGLGGGSADAAATLRALNTIFKAFSFDELIEISGDIGSDVPFCLIGGTALCEGRGEVVNPLPLLPKMHFVVALGDERVSTPTAYARLDELYNGFDGESYVPRRLNIEKDKPICKSCLSKVLYNIFESTAPSSALLLKERLLMLGAQAALMSGSGPSVFAVFDNAALASSARDALVSDGIYAEYAVSI